MSDQYRALTRKYRPVNFEDIVSQEHVSNTLKNAIEHNRLAHAYLFCGPRGVGKTTMARVLARTINEVDADVDGEALSNTLNIVEIDAASNNGVDDVRALRERVRIPPQNGRYKVYIIDEVHMLSKAAFNALLKTLEEPPAHAIFIFATTEPHKVLPTILSRCQRFDFRRIRVDEIVGRLKNIAAAEDISIDEESLHVVARKADGALRDGLGILDQVIAFCGTDIRHEEVLRALNVVSADILFELTEAIVSHDSSAGMKLIDRVLLDGHDIQEFLIGLTEHFRNLYFARESENLSLIEASADMKAKYKQVSSSFSEDDVMRLLHITNEAQYKIREAHQPRIQLEVTVLKLIRMERSDGLAKLMDEIRELKQLLDGNETSKDGQAGPNSGPVPSASKASGTGNAVQGQTGAKAAAPMQETSSAATSTLDKSTAASPRQDAITSATSAPESSSEAASLQVKSSTATSTQDVNTSAASASESSSEAASSQVKSSAATSTQDTFTSASPTPETPSGTSTQEESSTANPHRDSKRSASSTPDTSSAATGNGIGSQSSESLFGMPSLNRTKNRLSAVSRDEAVISIRAESGNGVVAHQNEDAAGIIFSGNLALAAKPQAGERERSKEADAGRESDRVKAGAAGVEAGDPSDNPVAAQREAIQREMVKQGMVQQKTSQCEAVQHDSLHQERTQLEAAQQETPIKETPQTEIFLHDIRKAWDNYLVLVKAKSNPAVYFAMQNTEPLELKKGELTVCCPDMFAMNLIQENRLAMQECMKKAAGVPLRFHCVLRKATEKDKTANDPYAQFKQLQQADPRIKTIIDLFGAELEY